MNISELHKLFLTSSGVATDTRNISQNTIFFALKGENFNGNQYAAEALKNGAKYAVIDESEFNNSNPNTILVPNCLETLQKLANYHRNHHKAKIISLTGSNGKTTTKELIYAVLNTSFNTIATIGNLNNHIGVPLTLLRITKDTEYAIVEMGANHLKEIELLSSIADPDYGYITNFGKAHLEGFGSLEGVVQGKSELYQHLITKKGFIFYNADDEKQVDKLQDYENKYSFSLQNNPADIQLQNKTTLDYTSVAINNTTINTQLVGLYNLPNIAIAISIGSYFNIPTDIIKKGIESYTPTNNRSQIIEKNSNKIILDAYNANPTSTAAALNNISNMNASNKLVILGDMFELGHESAAEHQNILNLATNLNLTVITLGKHYSNTTSNFRTFTEFEDLKTHLKNLNPSEHTILIKGSRGMKMERILELL